MIGCFVQETRTLSAELVSREHSALWPEGTRGVLACAFDRLADRASVLTTWQNNAEKLGHTFARFALPISWDYAESNPLVDTTGGFIQAVEWVAKAVEHTMSAVRNAPTPKVAAQSALAASIGDFDAIVTDPPYYDAIPYSDLMDFFYIWLRRALGASNGPFDAAFAAPVGPKWNADAADGELVDDASRFGGDRARSKANYEDGMARAFARCHAALTAEGRLVVVFANKNPAAWETLAAALIRAGFVVDGSWPIQTERQSRTRAMASAALSSSVWLVCRKRVAGLKPSWDHQVLAEMRDNIARRLREFWDAGIRGPDFVWAATGPALEAFSRHPVVKRAAAQGELMSVSEFLREARRMVVDFVVGRVLTHSDGGEEQAASGLDDVTTYYLLHRHTFGLAEAPIGAAILYAMSCNLSDAALIDRHDLLARKGAELALLSEEGDDGGDEDAGEAENGGGSGERVRLKGWNERHGRLLGLEGPGGSPPPLIDQIHRLVRLWKSGEEAKVNEYLDAKALARNEMFRRVLQAVLELGDRSSDERVAIEAISNHVAARAGLMPTRQGRLV